jgi:hypothetical protein
VENAPPSLGILRHLAASAGLWEYFWTPPTKREIRTALVKLYLVHNELYNQARGQKVPSDDVLPNLWILTTSAAATLLTGFRAVPKLPTWGPGVYWLGDSFKTAIVVLHQLPTTPDTLWLRLLAKGATRQQALQELLALPEEHPLRGPVLELINNYLTEINRQPELTDEEKEFIMELSPAYLQWREETLQHGKQQGQRLLVENLLKFRFGGLDDALLQSIDRLLQLSPEESSRLLLQLSHDEFIAQFGKPS